MSKYPYLSSISLVGEGSPFTIERFKEAVETIRNAPRFPEEPVLISYQTELEIKQALKEGAKPPLHGFQSRGHVAIWLWEHNESKRKS